MNNVTRKKTETVVVRPMVEADIDRIDELENIIFSDPWPRSAFDEQLDEEEGWGSIVALLGDKIVGYACYLIVAQEAHLTNIAVEPIHRRKSVAKQLLEYIIETVEDLRAEYLLLEVRPGNTEARAFYEKHGFRFLYRRPNYYRRPVEDALVLVKYFDVED